MSLSKETKQIGLGFWRSNEERGLSIFILSVHFVQVEKNKDNILPRIMAISGSYDRLFAEELKKYDPLKVILSAPFCKHNANTPSREYYFVWSADALAPSPFDESSKLSIKEGLQGFHG